MTGHMVLQDGGPDTGQERVSLLLALTHGWCWGTLRATGGDPGPTLKQCCSLPPASSGPLCLPRKPAWLQTPVLGSSSPTWEQGGGQSNGGSPEDASWPLNGLPRQGAGWRAWCVACGSWCWCPQSWLWKVRGGGDGRTPHLPGESQH